ncbi:MAG TPA: tellurite resistance TerB family protein [Pseudomonadales bacterium]
MNAKKILDQLMQHSSAKGTARSSGDTVDRLLEELSSRLGGSGGPGRARAGDAGQGGGIDLTSLIGPGALALLVGSKRGRRLGGSALKYGAIASLGALAWRAWQNHQAGQGGGAGDAAREGEPVERLEGDAGNRRSLGILQAIIMAARADGHIDQGERTQLSEQMNALGADEELRTWMKQQLDAPLDAEALARQADSPQAAREMYLASLAIVDEQNPMERAWLEQLAQALGIEPGLAAELEQQMTANA